MYLALLCTLCSKTLAAATWLLHLTIEAVDRLHKAQHVRSETRPYPTISMIVYRTRVNLLLHNQLMQASQIVILYSYRKPFHVLHWRCATAWRRVRDGGDVWLAGAPVGRREAAGGQCGREVELSCGRVVRRAKKREAGQGGRTYGLLLGSCWLLFRPGASALAPRLLGRECPGERREARNEQKFRSAPAMAD
jgi:hypothetical protein